MKHFINKNKKSELGLYIHIPFCVKKCEYCDFLSGSANNETKKAYVNALLDEIHGYHDLAVEYKITTIFIGGGTPSSIHGEYIIDIMDAIADVFQVTQREQLEITIEVNPGTLTREKLQCYRVAGINRLSFGLQSTNNQELKLLGRIHSYEEFVSNYKLAREIGFQNINIDLISAIPGQTIDDWLMNLQNIVALKPEHISAYSLIIEEGTPFFKQYAEEDQNEELDRTIYKKTNEYLQEAGYTHYEISNYARPGCQCLHNTSYWTRKNYLGIGLGASSLLTNTRFHNEESLEKYLKQSKNPSSIRRDVEELTIKQQMEEYMFLGLRLIRGISTNQFNILYGTNIMEVYGDAITKSIQEELLVLKDNTLYLSEKGIDLSNVVLSRFIFDA